ncbi:MAG: hypothetical protein PHW73_01720 [Atribacterota bacterium]|nr:hypothetical protein [Atribacterota bacterium]
MKVKSKKYIKNKLDKLYSLIIRSKGYCEVCGKTTNLQAHHVIGRIVYALRWDLQNGCCLCASCHEFGKQSAHQNPIWFIGWFKEHRPEDYKYLQKKKLESKTWFISDYEEIYQKLKEIYENNKRLV